MCAKDPIGYADGVNRYQLVLGAPLEGIDPSGKCTVQIYGNSFPHYGICVVPDGPGGHGGHAIDGDHENDLDVVFHEKSPRSRVFTFQDVTSEQCDCLLESAKEQNRVPDDPLKLFCPVCPRNYAFRNAAV